MLTTPNAQYLHPDYLQPLPTTVSIHLLTSRLVVVAKSFTSLISYKSVVVTGHRQTIPLKQRLYFIFLAGRKEKSFGSVSADV